MEPSQVRAVALIISLFLVAVPSATAGTGGYGAAPGLAGALPGQDPVPISFWDLTVREMLIAVSLSFCPVLMYPVEIFFFLKMMAALGYRKVERNAVLWNRNRQKIYDCIAANPGVKFNALERLTGVKEGTLKYHVLILGMKRRIVSFGSGRSVRYFENNGRYSELEKKVFLHLQNPTTRRILEILASSPEVSRKEIAGILGIAGPSITWHTKRLSGDGIITTSKKGRAVRYTLCPAGADIFRRFRGQDPGMAFRSAVTGEEPGK
ncbi:MAG: winged helix-turn-helix transcriptional regulator [Methanoregula sp.]|jgi:predicted transcriptional regulator|uniref:winged helix-turn-helix transcriptional regulator n=1 Tax=Methanoregula sp. TaxID=2052170 RepID=UPI003D0E9FE6